jgi:antirestriction protein
MPTLYANPYDISKSGFYFKSAEEFEKKEAKHPAEEFEIEFIDGDADELALFDAMDVDQSNVEDYYDALDDLDEDEIIAIVILMKDIGYDFESARDNASDLVVYGEFDSDEDFAMEYVDGIGSIEDALGDRAEIYFDYDAFGRDLRLGGDLYDPDDPDAEDRWEGMSDQEIGEEWTDDMGGPAEVMSMLGKKAEYYFDWERFARDLMMDMSRMGKVYYDPNSV